MKIVVDECLPVEIKKLFEDFDLITVNELNWTGLKNGELLTKIVDHNFDIFLTVDKKLRFQQNLKNLKLSFIVLDIFRNKIEEVSKIKNLIIESFNSIKPNEIFVINSTKGIQKINN